MKKLLPQHLTVAAAEEIAGRLGKTSKMPGPSYGLSAKRCITGSKLKQTPGSVCSTCYAENAFYASWAPLAKGHSKRHDSLDHPRWIDANGIRRGEELQRLVRKARRDYRALEKHLAKCTPRNDPGPFTAPSAKRKR